ncbi:MAG TPA: carbon-nitrogen family hydrolase [Acidimicrobiales bacterium]|nr:carbon-nitrogen family hydrolase [Acidimicrobiales bacterium]
MRVALVQHDIVWERTLENLDRLDAQVAAAAGSGARLVVLSEMFSTGFSMNTADVAEDLDGPSVRRLRRWASDHSVWTCASVPVVHARGERPYNTLFLVSPDGEMHTYRKIHPFGYSSEPDHYGAGGEFLTVDVEGLRVSTFVCYDLRFANEFWALAPDTDMYVIPANWPASRREQWSTLLRARAIENQAYVVAVNRVGIGHGSGPDGAATGEIAYSGDSAAIDPLGRVLVSAAHREALLVTEVTAETVAEVRRQFPFMADRRQIPAG